LENAKYIKTDLIIYLLKNNIPVNGWYHIKCLSIFDISEAMYQMPGLVHDPSKSYTSYNYGSRIDFPKRFHCH
jgi:hypothetical protein